MTQGMSSTNNNEETILKQALTKLESQISEQKQLIEQILQLKQKKYEEEKSKLHHIKSLVNNQEQEEIKSNNQKENKVIKPKNNTNKKNKKNTTMPEEIESPVIVDNPFTRKVLSNRFKYYYQNRYFFSGYKFVLNNNTLILVSTNHELTNKPLLNAESMPPFIVFKGITYIKSPSGNYTAEILNKNTPTKTQKPFCLFYTTTGNCTKTSCNFRHIPGRTALCPSIQGTKQKCSDYSCHFSHLPSQYNAPSCKFFQSGDCNNENCKFIHKLENPKAPVCREFAYAGYCEDGLECRFTHSKQCPDLKEYGRCLRGRSCMCIHNDEMMKRDAKAMEIRNKDNDNVIQIVYDKNSDSDGDSNSGSESDDDNVEFIVGPLGHELSSNENFVKF